MSTVNTGITASVSEYLEELFSGEDNFLRTLNVEAAAAGIPPISIAPVQTRFLQVLLKGIGARNVLEIGSLAGYSTIAMARALPADGRLFACELNAAHAAFIRKKVAEANLDSIIHVVEGVASDTLQSVFDNLSALPSPKLDAVFIDADKENYNYYLSAVLPHMRKGGLIIADNALAFGFITSEPPLEEKNNVVAIRAFNTIMSKHKQLLSTLVPLGDGMVIGVVQ